MDVRGSDLAAIAADDVTLAEGRRAAITARLPWLAAGWLGIGILLRAGLTLRGVVTPTLALTSIGLQALVFGVAIARCRADPCAPRVLHVAFAAVLALVTLAVGFCVAQGSSVEQLVASVLILCMGSSWAFAWGWRMATALLAVSGVIAVPAVLATPAIQRFSDPIVILLEAALGAAITVVVAEVLARSAARAFAQAAAARGAAQRLEEAYQAYRDLAENARDMIYTHDLDGRITYVNEAFARAYGVPASALVGRSADSLVPRDAANPDPRALRARMAAGEDLAPQLYWVRGPRGRRWLECVASPIRDGDGRIVGSRGIVRDVTERREVEEALRASLEDLRRSEDRLRSLARHQASIREDERKRLGFDLHDDVCQELVGIGILVESVRRRAGQVAPALAADLGRIARYVGEVGEHLRQLAHDLRPMPLRELGLVESLRSLADGMSTPETTVVTEVRTAIPRLEEEVEIGVYRIAQESLANALRHAGARAIGIALAIGAEGLVLEVTDDGCGFDPDARGASESLGLVGMEERALALGGWLVVRSAPGTGTSVRLVCPAPERRASAA